MVFDNITKIILFPIYYIFHKNIFFGYLHKKLIKKFYYKNYKFYLNDKFIPLQNYSSFLFKTYEYNDKTLIEKNLNTKNKCIVIGGGLGFIATLAYNISKKKIIVFEINKEIIPLLKKNLKINKCIFKIFLKNLVIFKKKKNKTFYLSDDFLNTTSRQKTKKKTLVQNITYKEIDPKRYCNTMIIDAEGDEEYYINSLNYLKNINHIFFELHYNIFNNHQVKKIMMNLKKNNFILKDKCFNSFYFIRDLSK